MLVGENSFDKDEESEKLGDPDSEGEKSDVGERERDTSSLSLYEEESVIDCDMVSVGDGESEYVLLMVTSSDWDGVSEGLCVIENEDVFWLDVLFVL